MNDKPETPQGAAEPPAGAEPAAAEAPPAAETPSAGGAKPEPTPPGAERPGPDQSPQGQAESRPPDEPTAAKAGTAASGQPGAAKPEEKSVPPEQPAGRGYQEWMRAASGQTQDQWEWWRAGAPYFDTAHIEQINYFQSGAHLYQQQSGRQQANAGLLEDEYALINSVYVPPSQFDEAYACLDRQRWVILVGQPNVGKRAAAIRLAITFMPDYQSLQQAVREMSPDSDLRAWHREGQIEQNAFYIVGGLISTRAQELGRYDWGEIGKRLAQRQSYLVVCAQSGARLATELPDEAIIYWSAPEDLPRLLRKHLAFYNVPAEQVDDLLAEPEVAQQLAQRPTPERIKKLARRISRYASGEVASLAEALAGFTAYDDGTIAARFKMAKDDRERAWQMALAVLSGARQRQVQAAVDRLAEHLAENQPQPKAKQGEPSAETRPEVRTSLFDDLFDDPLERAQAVVETVYREDEGKRPVEIVRYRDEAFGPALLAFIWRRGFALRSPLLKWLRELGYARDREVRVRVAWAVAQLARFDLETILQELFGPWAELGDVEMLRRSRVTLSYACGSLALIPEFTETVLALLREWAGPERSPRRTQAAVRAYTVVGQLYPREAMSQWRRVLRSRPFELHFFVTETLGIALRDDELRPLFDSLIDAILTFFFNSLQLPPKDFRRVYADILAELREWLTHDGESQFMSSIALTLVLSLIQLSIEEGGQVEGGGHRQLSAPALLILAQGMSPSDATLRDLAFLLSLTIRDQRTRAVALNGVVDSETKEISGGIYGWLDYVETDRNLLPALEAILKALVQEKEFKNQRWQRELGRRMEWWATQRVRPGRRPLSVAGELVRKLGIQRV